MRRYSRRPVPGQVPAFADLALAADAPTMAAFPELEPDPSRRCHTCARPLTPDEADTCPRCIPTRTLLDPSRPGSPAAYWPAGIGRALELAR